MPLTREARALANVIKIIDSYKKFKEAIEKNSRELYTEFPHPAHYPPAHRHSELLNSLKILFNDPVSSSLIPSDSIGIQVSSSSTDFALSDSSSETLTFQGATALLQEEDFKKLESELNNYIDKNIERLENWSKWKKIYYHGGRLTFSSFVLLCKAIQTAGSALLSLEAGVPQFALLLSYTVVPSSALLNSFLFIGISSAIVTTISRAPSTSNMIDPSARYLLELRTGKKPSILSTFNFYQVDDDIPIKEISNWKIKAAKFLLGFSIFGALMSTFPSEAGIYRMLELICKNNSENFCDPNWMKGVSAIAAIASSLIYILFRMRKVYNNSLRLFNGGFKESTGKIIFFSILLGLPGFLNAFFGNIVTLPTIKFIQKIMGQRAQFWMAFLSSLPVFNTFIMNNLLSMISWSNELYQWLKEGKHGKNRLINHIPTGLIPKSLFSSLAALSLVHLIFTAVTNIFSLQSLCNNFYSEFTGGKKLPATITYDTDDKSDFITTLVLWGLTSLMLAIIFYSTIATEYVFTVRDPLHKVKNYTDRLGYKIGSIFNKFTNKTNVRVIKDREVGREATNIDRNANGGPSFFNNGTKICTDKKSRNICLVM